MEEGPDQPSPKATWRKPAVIAGAVIAVIAIIMIVSYQREMSEKRQAAEEGTAALLAYRTKLQEVARVLSAATPAGETVCSDAVIEKAAHGRARVRLELLSQANLTEITSAKPLTSERATQWMTGGWIRLIHWEAAPGSPDLGDAARLLGNIARDSGSLIGVIKVTTLTLPKLTRDEPDASPTEAIIPGTFIPGVLSAWLFVVDTDSATIACQARMESTSSESVEYKRKLLLMNDAETKLQDDFVAQARAQADQVAARMHPKLTTGL